ncbi:MAG: 6-phosphofructokinase [Bacteroidales bacterium]|nr:6-phosphofructokinase [Bacteroidales bacterium]
MSEDRKRTLAIITSGGDAPGMNACVRAVTRSAIFKGWKVFGVYRGYEGLMNGLFEELTSSSVSNMIQRGGTFLKTARSEEFMTPEGHQKAHEQMLAHGADTLIVIGGNGSLTGARDFAKDFPDIAVIGIPGTIDNDLYGTDLTIGYDTALNTIVDCVDKIRDTATSHDRIFFIEVMGRDAGFLAQNSAIASGAEAAIIPEDQTDVDQLAQFISRGMRKSKNSSIVIVSEAKSGGNGGAMYYADRVRKEYPQYDVRVTILGHLQRGGTPSASDRILASRLGYAAIEALDEGQRNIMVGIDDDKIVYVPITRAVKQDKPIDKELISVLSVLSI